MSSIIQDHVKNETASTVTFEKNEKNTILSSSLSRRDLTPQASKTGSWLFKKHYKFLLLLGDIVLLNLAYLLVYFIQQKRIFIFNINLLLFLILITILSIILFHFYGLYHTTNKMWAEVCASLIVSIGWLVVFTITILYFIKLYNFPRSVFIIPTIQLITLLVWRWLMLKWERRIIPPKKVIIISNVNEGKKLIEKSNYYHLNILGLITEKLDLNDNYLPIIGVFEQLEDVFKKYSPEIVYVSENISEKLKIKIFRLCMRSQCQVLIVPGLFEICLSGSRLDQVSDSPVFDVRLKVKKEWLQLKRCLDIFTSTVCFIILLPLMLLIALLIKIDSPGPVFYLQERVGKNNKQFMLYKFRTMINDAEKHSGPVLALEKDSRITKIGRFLRAARLDELPQLINVIKGDMSIVGPRPERPYFVKQYEKQLPEYSYRHLINPGITGLAQVAGRYSTSFDDKLRYDLYYIENTSFFFDVKIILQTIKVLLIKDKSL